LRGGTTNESAHGEKSCRASVLPNLHAHGARDHRYGREAPQGDAWTTLRPLFGGPGCCYSGSSPGGGIDLPVLFDLWAAAFPLIVSGDWELR
jgi:hypothetical protein